MLYLFVLIVTIFAIKTAPLEPFQGSWQASVPIPIKIQFDVPQSSLIQANSSFSPSFLQIIPPFANPPAGNNYALRLVPPEETEAVISEEMKALKFQEEVGAKLHRSEVQSRGVVLLDAVSRGVQELVNDLMAPLRALPNPLA